MSSCRCKTVIAVWLLILIACPFVAAQGAADGPAIHAYYFRKRNCPMCRGTDATAEQLLRKDPQVRLKILDIFEPDEYEIADALLTVAGIPKAYVPVSPGLLIGGTYLDVGQFRRENVVRALSEHRATGAPDMMAKAMAIRGHARETLPLQFRSWGILPVLAAGLVDAFNPCAIATLVFFLSYLAMMGFSRRVTILTGLSFAAGVFLAYFAFGYGLLHAIHVLDAFPAIRQIIQVVIGVICLVFAGITLRDYRRIKQGQVGDVSLQLSSELKRRTHGLIRGGLRARLIVPAALVAGAGVSALELACTGQVYVPAIIYMFSVSETRADAFRWLLLYDAMFVLPLLVLLFLVTRGISSKRLADLARGQAGKSKLLMAVLFALAGAYFLSLSLPKS